MLGDPATRHFLSDDDMAFLEGCAHFALLRRLNDAPEFEMNLTLDCEEIAEADSLEAARALIQQTPGVTHVRAGDRLVLAAALCPDHERPGGIPTRKRDLATEAWLASSAHALVPEFATLLSAAAADPTLASQRLQNPGQDVAARYRAYRDLQLAAATPSSRAHKSARAMLHYYHTRRRPVVYRALRAAEVITRLTRYPAMIAGALAVVFFFALAGAGSMPEETASGLTAIYLLACLGLGTTWGLAEVARRYLDRLHCRPRSPHVLEARNPGPGKPETHLARGLT
ncbi:hypothetical protein CKO28_03175 [Rhodovibrio sodomensis]|uniref:Uncharacterized protein n=1 Tax=Rhodovibrio sodomensis TaxID=1088 RepID=A0ABS1DAU6_9PROT|nr:hypothetical protein [Rhodovibrio sodomensis]